MTALSPQDFHSIEDAIRHHRGHYFDASTMQFFRSRVLSQVFPGKDEVYFVTSEQFVSSRGEKALRRFTVRAYNPATDNIRTIQPFNELLRAKALRIARDLAQIIGIGSAA